tara:strand:- start:50 stop:271 length:222 start_codon:yes stop_codon:yes gene_type:complete
MSVIADNLSVKYGCEGLEPTNSDGWLIPLFVTAAEAQTLLAGYDPANKYSPSADESREIARVFLDALKAASGS